MVVESSRIQKLKRFRWLHVSVNGLWAARHQKSQNLEDETLCSRRILISLEHPTPRAHTFRFFSQSSKGQHLEEERVSLTCRLVERKVAFETSGVRRRIFYLGRRQQNCSSLLFPSHSRFQGFRDRESDFDLLVSFENEICPLSTTEAALDLLSRFMDIGVHNFLLVRAGVANTLLSSGCLFHTATNKGN